MFVISNFEEWFKVAEDADLRIVQTSDGSFFALKKDEYDTMIGMYSINRGYIDLERR